MTPLASNADISGAFQRPTLVDYLIVADHEQLDLSLHLHIGALEVGQLGVSGGQVVFAELPGATGDAAVSLLAQLPNARIMPEAWTTKPTNVSTPWRELIDERLWKASPGRKQRLAQIRAELRELDAEIAAESGVYAVPRPELNDDDARALRIAAELIDWVAIEAYLHGEVDRAHVLMSQRERLRPGDLISAANLERLRLRLLEDELASGIAQVQG